MIGLQRLRDDVEALAKHKINGAKGGKKRAENYRNKQEEVKEDKYSSGIVYNISETFLNATRSKQISFLEMMIERGEQRGKIKAYENAMKPY